MSENSRVRRVTSLYGKQAVRYLINSNWSQKRNQKGILFAPSNNSKTFHQILSILVNDLSSKDKIHTICADEDLRLASACTETLIIENKTDADQKIFQLNRVICF